MSDPVRSLSTFPAADDARARRSRSMVVAGLITSAVGLVLCPFVGQLTGASLAFAGQQTTPAGRRPSLGRLPLVTYLLAGVGLVVWTAIFGVAAGTATRSEKLTTSPPATTTTTIAEDLTATPTTFPVPSGDAALLAALRVGPEHDPGGYDRDRFGYPGGGTDGRGCNTRERVLQRDSAIPATVGAGCRVVAGRWTDAYTGTTYEDPAAVSIDHLVALKEAYASGASAWSSVTMAAFANDVDRPQALRVIGGSGNQSKGDKDPAEWMPPLPSAVRDYARAWLTVKVAYGLTADQAEADALRAALAAPPPAAAVPALSPIPPTIPTTTSTSGPPPTASPATTATTPSVRFVSPGAFCAPGGATGITSTGRAMVCSTTAQDARNRWRAA